MRALTHVPHVTPLRQQLGLRGKCAGIMETGRVIGGGGRGRGTAVHDLAVILSGQSEAARLDQCSDSMLVDLTGWPTSVPNSAV